MKPCRITGTPTVADGLDFGPQPICHRFLTDRNGAEPKHRLALGVCERSGLLQLVDPPPASLLEPIYPWIIYNEPERHLDDVADVLVSLTDLNRVDLLFGISYKDESTLRRLRERGFSNAVCADLEVDYGGLPTGSGVETIQSRLTRETVRRIVARRGRPKLVVMRHVFEHCHDIREVAAALKELVAPDGYIVLEMPDTSQALEHLDYTTIWEEHVFYFTPNTLRTSLENLGFTVEYLHSYPAAHENSLIAVIRPRPPKAHSSDHDRAGFAEELQRAKRFLREFATTREEIARALREFSDRRGGVCFLGAGHLTCTFINIMGIADAVRFVVDDDRNKTGKFMPGSCLPIVGSQALLEEDVKLCLFSVRPEIEEAVVRKNQAFLDRGGTMASIFPRSPYACTFRNGLKLARAA
jgi:hypothetical protein